MTVEAQRIAIAEACGWEKKVVVGSSNPPMWHHPDGVPIGFVPDYLSDLSAMHEVEKVIEDRMLLAEYVETLHEVQGGDNEYLTNQEYFDMIHATAAQRAEAFLKTIGKWQE